MKKQETKNRNVENQEKSEYEKCICCKRITDIPVNMHIELRPFYIEGAGQLCCDCYKELYH